MGTLNPRLIDTTCAAVNQIECDSESPIESDTGPGCSSVQNGMPLPVVQLNPELSDALYIPTCNMAVTTCTLVAVGGFDETFPSAAFEDVEFCVRARKLGSKVWVASRDACSGLHHAYAVSWAGFSSQFHRYGRAHPLMLAKHPEYEDWYAASTELTSRQTPTDSLGVPNGKTDRSGGHDA